MSTSAVPDPSGLSQIVSRARRYLALTNGPGLPPPCDDLPGLRARCADRLKLDLPEAYGTLLAHCDGLMLDHFVYFGSSRRPMEIWRDDGVVERVAVPALIEENLALREESPDLARYLILGREEGGLLAFCAASGHFVTLDHCHARGEELPTLRDLLRFTLGRVVPME
jgi:hypothetical protein